MRVGTKLTIVTVAGVLLVLGFHGYLRIEREVDLLTVDMERDHLKLARGLGLAAQVVADRSGFDAAIELLKEANERESKMTISWSAPGDGAAAARRGTHAERVTQGGEQWLITRVPLPLRGTPGVLQLRESLTQPLSYVHSTIVRTALVMAQVAFLCVIVIVTSSLVFVQRPLRQLMAKVRRVGEGHLRDPVLIKQRDEIGELAREIGAMCEQLDHARARLEVETKERIAAVEQMRHADRLRMVGHVASGIAHELGTPLNVVLAHARSIARQSAAETERSDAGVIVEQVERMSKIIRQLLDLARPHAPRRQAEDIRSVVGATLAMFEPVAAKRGVELSGPAGDEPIAAEVDASQISQVLANLVINAIQAQQNGGAVRVGLDRANGSVRIRVEDDGPGIPADAIDRIFEPFFTTKDPGAGTGLGLAVSDGIVRDHGGHIEVANRPSGGTVFTVSLPESPVADAFEEFFVEVAHA